jgi:hypothetical protein
MWTTSLLFDYLGIKRTSFALENPIRDYREVNYNHANIYESTTAINESISDSDLLFIDSAHNYEMAKFQAENILEANKEKNIIIHDWFDNNEVSYTEQQYWLENIIGKQYEVVLLSSYIRKSRNLDLDLDLDENFSLNSVPPCLAILQKIY